MLINPYVEAQFLKSAALLTQLPSDEGFEVAFAGRSNAGKSSALNCLTKRKALARTSKTPGCTQLINLFKLDELRRLVDLPGYGYAKVAKKTKEAWLSQLSQYLTSRTCLKGLIILMDSRHPLKELDKLMINFSIAQQLPVHILLTKVDKLNRNDTKNTLLTVSNYCQPLSHCISVQTFSSLKKIGVDELVLKLNCWFQR